MSDPELLERQWPYRGKMLDLSVDRLRLPGGRETELEIVRHPGAAAVVPLTGDGDVLMVRQYRYAVGGWLLEVPAGKLDEGEAPEACARRELAEETGFRPGRLTPLGSIWTSPGFTDERIWLYVAENLEPAQQELESDELLSVVRMPLAEAVAMAASGELPDSKSACALLRAARRLG